MIVLPWERPGIKDFMPGTKSCSIPFVFGMPTCIPPPAPPSLACCANSVDPADVCPILWSMATCNVNDYDWREKEDAG